MPAGHCTPQGLGQGAAACLHFPPWGLCGKVWSLPCHPQAQVGVSVGSSGLVLLAGEISFLRFFLATFSQTALLRLLLGIVLVFLAAVSTFSACPWRHCTLARAAASLRWSRRYQRLLSKTL